jgi:hypothetical protein
VLIAQDRRRVEVWRRDGERWVHDVHAAGEAVRLPSIDFTLDVDELYAIAGVKVH